MPRNFARHVKFGLLGEDGVIRPLAHRGMRGGGHYGTSLGRQSAVHLAKVGRAKWSSDGTVFAPPALGEEESLVTCD